MKNNKGFSLIEILGVIVILSLLTVATFTVLDGVARRNTNKTYQLQVNEILDGAINYANNEKVRYIPNTVSASGCKELTINSAIPSSTDKICKFTISLQTLFDEGIIDDDIKNPKNKKKILGTSTIVVTYLEYEENGSISVSDNKKISGRNLYTLNIVEG